MLPNRIATNQCEIDVSHRVVGTTASQRMEVEQVPSSRCHCGIYVAISLEYGVFFTSGMGQRCDTCIYTNVSCACQHFRTCRPLLFTVLHALFDCILRSPTVPQARGPYDFHS